MNLLTGDQFVELWKDRATTLEQPERVEQVQAILDGVKQQGDKALVEYGARFDGVELSPHQLQVTAAELEGAREQLAPEVWAALEQAAANIRAFYQKGRTPGWDLKPCPGGLLGEVVRPLEQVGLYIPGGLASYPSSVLMTAIPAQVAGVQEIVLCTPPGPEGRLDPAVLAAAQLAGVTKIFRVGGAQAVAALNYGTESVPKVDKIFGPGNTYVTLAKKLVAGEVGIDGLAGPSEVLVLADDNMPPAWAAADLLAQAEHDPEAAAILVTTSNDFAQTVADEVDRQLAALPRCEITAQALKDRGAVVVVESWEEALDLVNLVAPEHLQLALTDPWSLVAGVKNAGAIFLGYEASVPLGDYAAGPSHVLPTGGTARFASYLGLEDFCKRSSLLYIDTATRNQLADTVVTLARAEGLEAHARAVLIRGATSPRGGNSD